MATARRRRKSSPDVQAAEGKIRVHSSVNNEEGTETEEIISVQQFMTEPAYVRVNAGVTRSIADYESLRVDVSVSLPCYKEEVDAALDLAGEIAAAHLDSEVDQYLKG